MPLNTYLGNMKELREQNFNFSLLLSGGFLLLTFLIAGAMSRPIALLRRKMALSAQGELNTRVEESFFHGEMRDLAATFNTMMTDIGGLLQKLKLEERQKEALHYQMLTAQMNPHFLLNTLNTIKWIAYEKEEDELAEISISLGKLLETSLYSDVELIPLQNELDLLQAYVYIQNIRYEGKVKVTLDVEEGLAYALVPKLVLQPLMENAFKHGFSTLQEDARVSVRARRSGRTLILELEDNGVGLARAGEHPELRTRKGIGIANIRQRLQLLFREDGSLVLLEGEKGTMARITIPLLIANPFQSGGVEHVENSSG
jgi:two-component system sensor histidine kinase YesM